MSTFKTVSQDENANTQMSDANGQGDLTVCILSLINIRPKMSVNLHAKVLKVK